MSLSQEPTKKITGKCIWITGASSGIGSELARQFCIDGNFVIVSARRVEALSSLAEPFAGKMVVLPFDVSADTNQLLAARERLQGITDYLDMVIACAGVCEYEDRLEFDPSMYRRVMDVNFIGVINTLHLAMPLLRACTLRPHIVAVGSLTSVVPFPRAEAYGASKAALEYFMMSLATDLSHWPVDVSLVRPGFVATPMTNKNDFSMPFMVSAESSAQYIIQGLQNKRRIIDFPRRLSWPLRFFGACLPLWFRWVAPRISRHFKSSWVKNSVNTSLQRSLPLQ